MFILVDCLVKAGMLRCCSLFKDTKSTVRVVTEPNQVRLQVETHAVVTCAVLLLECWHSLKKKKCSLGQLRKKKVLVTGLWNIS